MRPITLKQWEKMKPRSRDWLVVKALGFFVKYFWHVSMDGTRDGIKSGSFSTKEFAEEVRKYRPNKFPKSASVRRDICYWCVTSVPNCAQEVVEEMLRRGWRCDLTFNPDGTRTARFFADCRSYFLATVP